MRWILGALCVVVWAADHALADGCGCDLKSEPCPAKIAICGDDWMHGREYIPTVPVNETRAAITVLVPPPTPLIGSESDAGTPRCGGYSIHIARVSDERTLTDRLGNVYASDGEVQLTTFEWVSKRFSVCVGGHTIPFHVGASLSGYSLHGALFDGLRNFVEENLLNADPAVIAAHDIGGRELNVTTAGGSTDLLSAWPMLKAKAFLKVPLPDWQIGCSHLRTSVSVGLTTPSFGQNADSGNSAFQPEAVFAWSAPLWKHLRWIGSANVCLPGGSDRYDTFGLDHQDVCGGAATSLEWWFSWRWALAGGLLWNSAYTRNSGLPTDLASTYATLGLLYRIDCRSDIHLTFSENLEAQINTGFGSDFSDSQKESDFTLMLGFRHSF